MQEKSESLTPNEKTDKIPHSVDRIESVMEPVKLKPIIVRLPRDRGITGIAIQNKQVQVVHNGDYNVNFAAEVDNAIGLPVVRNSMIGPCFDTKG